VYFDEAGGFVDTPVYDRAELRPGNVIPGPAIIEQMDATTVLLPGQRATVDSWANLLISAETYSAPHNSAWRPCWQRPHNASFQGL